jgi:hypothetical protein
MMLLYLVAVMLLAWWPWNYWLLALGFIVVLRRAWLETQRRPVDLV